MITARELICKVEADGIHLQPTERGTLKAGGSRELINRWVPVLRKRKSELLRELRRPRIYRLVVDGKELTAISQDTMAVFQVDVESKFGKHRVSKVVPWISPK